MAAEWSIELLGAGHERARFSCGKESLDCYIQQYARQHARKNIGRTFVAVRRPEKRVLGYYTLASSSVAFEHLPNDIQSTLPRYPVPVVLLGKLAVDESVRGQGLGEHLLMDACHRVAAIAKEVAIAGLEVDALDASASAFYQHYGFRPFRDHPLHLFLPLKTFDRLF